MSVPQAARPFGAVRAAPAVARPAGAFGPLVRAGLASSLHRFRAGEGALLAVNLSLVAYHGGTAAHAVAQVLVSALTLGVMYAFNDLWDAPADRANPKKDTAVVAVWARHRHTGMVALAALKAAAVAAGLVLLGPRAGAAVAGVMVANLAYSLGLKGVPVVDVAWCALWGALYAAIVDATPSLLVLVALMTAVCHLFQTLVDREPDAANGIATTAVRSAMLSRTVLVALTVLLFVAVRPVLGPVAAATACTPLALSLGVSTPRRAWLLTKVYFAALWLSVLGISGAAG